MMNKIVDYGFKGLGIGFIITNIMLYIFMYSDGALYNGQEIIKCYMVWAGASVLFGLASLVYDFINVGHLYQTFIHFLLISVISFLTTSYMLKSILGQQVNLMTDVFPSFILSFVIIYLVIWSGIYFIEKSRLNKLNAKFK